MTVADPARGSSLVAEVEAAVKASAAAGDGSAFDPARLLELDRQERFPDLECALLDRCGAPRAYLPPEWGGATGGLPETVEVLRAVARHDVTVAVAHGKTFLGTAPIWVAGSHGQREWAAREVLGSTAFSWGLTEPDRGSDLLSGRLTAGSDPAGWRLDGAKWPVNNATRGRVCTVLARTDPAGGPRGFGLFVVDKSTLSHGSWRCLPKQPTHGVRGADISGIAFEGAVVGDDALVGRPGSGVETVLSALQLTRTVCTALTLGAAGQALRLGLGFAAERQLYGTTLLRLPQARHLLGAAASSLLLAEAASAVAARCAHALPGEMSVVSSVVKAGVPDWGQDAIDTVAELLGVRGFLVGHPAYGAFEKLERDHRVAAVFDGTTAVNRNALINQFPTLARRFADRRCARDGLRVAADPAAPLPDLDHRELRLISRDGCSLVQALPDALSELATRATSGGEHGRVPDRVVHLAELLEGEARRLLSHVAALSPTPREVPTEAFELARRYEVCFAAAAAVHLWLAEPRPERRGPLWDEALWLEATLDQALSRLNPTAQRESQHLDCADRLVTALERHGPDRWTSPFSSPHRTASAAPAAAGTGDPR